MQVALPPGLGQQFIAARRNLRWAQVRQKLVPQLAPPPLQVTLSVGCVLGSQGEDLAEVSINHFRDRVPAGFAGLEIAPVANCGFGTLPHFFASVRRAKVAYWVG